MKISPISQEVGLPAHVPVVAARSGGRRTTQETRQVSEQPRPVHHEVVAADPGLAPIEPVINGEGVGLRFLQDKDAGLRIIQVIDEDTGDVIRQIPPEEVVDFMRQFQEAKGHFVSRRF